MPLLPNGFQGSPSLSVLKAATTAVKPRKRLIIEQNTNRRLLRKVARYAWHACCRLTEHRISPPAEAYFSKYHEKYSLPNDRIRTEYQSHSPLDTTIPKTGAFNPGRAKSGKICAAGEAKVERERHLSARGGVGLAGDDSRPYSTRAVPVERGGEASFTRSHRAGRAPLSLLSPSF